MLQSLKEKGSLEWNPMPVLLGRWLNFEREKPRKQALEVSLGHSILSILMLSRSPQTSSNKLSGFTSKLQTLSLNGTPNSKSSMHSVKASGADVSVKGCHSPFHPRRMYCPASAVQGLRSHTCRLMVFKSRRWSRGIGKLTAKDLRPFSWS